MPCFHIYLPASSFSFKLTRRLRYYFLRLGITQLCSNFFVVQQSRPKERSPTHEMKPSYHAQAAKKNREKKKAEELNLRERNDYLERNMVVLKRKYDSLVEEYESLRNNSYQDKTTSNLGKVNNQLLKEEIFFYRDHKSKVMDLVLNLRQEANLQKEVFQVRRNFYQLLASVSKLSLKTSNKPRMKTKIILPIRKKEKEVELNMFYEEKRVNGRLKREMTIDINLIPLGFMRLAYLWHALQDDKEFMRKLGLKLCAGQRYGRVFSTDMRNERKIILSNNEFRLKTGNKKSFFLSGINKQENEVTLVNTCLPDYSKSLEELKTEHPILYKAAVFKKAPGKNMCNLSLHFSYEDPPFPIESEFTKQAFLDFVRKNSPQRNISFIESLLKHCLLAAG